jgi:hypothetical protein
MEPAPRNAIVLARLSDLRDDDERGVDGQVQDGHDYARRIGWGIGPRLSHVIIENSETGNGLRGYRRSRGGDSRCRTAGPSCAPCVRDSAGRSGRGGDRPATSGRRDGSLLHGVFRRASRSKTKAGLRCLCSS